MRFRVPLGASQRFLWASHLERPGEAWCRAKEQRREGRVDGGKAYRRPSQIWLCVTRTRHLKTPVKCSYFPKCWHLRDSLQQRVALQGQGQSEGSFAHLCCLDVGGWQRRVNPAFLECDSSQRCAAGRSHWSCCNWPCCNWSCCNWSWLLKRPPPLVACEACSELGVIPVVDLPHSCSAPAHRTLAAAEGASLQHPSTGPVTSGVRAALTRRALWSAPSHKTTQRLSVGGLATPLLQITETGFKSLYNEG